jgi:tetratricopeptide (TPR) repeat protein
VTAWQVGDLVLDEFVVEGELGRGGMGIVYGVRSRTTRHPFAVKRSQLPDPVARLDFLAELQSWVDLPDHPHVTACHFFRSIGDEIAVFAERVDGGSLAAWIRRPEPVGPEVLIDLAIQSAWGLQAVHDSGLVHQDFKPGNVLLTHEGVAKVTDFGLARARARAGGADPETDALVSMQGMTPAYRSPEQAARLPLTFRTDIWSWGLSVLEAFTGEVTWLAGEAAPDVLADYLEHGAAVSGRPVMPPAVADVVAQCFRPDPSKRWGSMADAARALVDAYEGCARRAYPRAEPPRFRPTAAHPHDRRTTTGVQWDDPRRWLEKAFREAGRGAAEVPLVSAARSRKAQAIADLTAYEQALQIFEALATPGRPDLAREVAGLCAHKALIHQTVGDTPGALRLQDRAIELVEGLVSRGRTELTPLLAAASHDKGVAVADSGDGRGALALYERAISLCEQALASSAEVAPLLATALSSKANALCGLGQSAAGLACHDRAIEAFAGLAERDPAAHLERLAAACMNKGVALEKLGDLRSAVAIYDRAIRARGRLVEDGRSEIANLLASACMNKANALRLLGDLAGAVELYDRVIGIREPLVRVENRGEVSADLASAYMNKALALQALGEPRGALDLYDQAIEIRERLVRLEDRRELVPELALAFLNKGNAAHDLGLERLALSLADRAVALYERLVDDEGRRELAAELAMACSNKANSLLCLGEPQAALAFYDRSIRIRLELFKAGAPRAAAGLALACLNEARAVGILGDPRGALMRCERSIRLLQGLGSREPREEADLAEAHAYRARLLMEAGDAETAVASYDAAIALFEGLAQNHSAREAAESAAMGLVNSAVALKGLGRLPESLQQLDRAAGIRRRLVAEGRLELAGGLARALAYRAELLILTGRLSEARAEAHEAVALLEREAGRTGRPDLLRTLEWARQTLAPVL